jgi:hypothetical protein
MDKPASALTDEELNRTYRRLSEKIWRDGQHDLRHRYNEVEEELTARIQKMSDADLQQQLRAATGMGADVEDGNWIRGQLDEELRNRTLKREREAYQRDQEERRAAYAAQSDAELNAELLILQQRDNKPGGDADARRKIKLIAQELGRREKEREAFNQRNTRRQTMAAVIAAVAAVVALFTPLGPWVRRLLGEAWRALFQAASQ